MLRDRGGDVKNMSPRTSEVQESDNWSGRPSDCQSALGALICGWKGLQNGTHDHTYQHSGSRHTSTDGSAGRKGDAGDSRGSDRDTAKKALLGGSEFRLCRSSWRSEGVVRRRRRKARVGWHASRWPCRPRAWRALWVSEQAKKAAEESMTTATRGEIWLADLSPTRGHDQAGRRPVLVVSEDLFNRGPAGLVIVLPMTSTIRAIPSHVPVSPPEGGLKTKTAVLCEGIRSISTDRLVQRWGAVMSNTMTSIEDRLRILLRL